MATMSSGLLKVVVKLTYLRSGVFHYQRAIPDDLRGRYGSKVVRLEGIEQARGAVSGVRTSSGMLAADRYLFALGSYSPLLAKSVGIDLPIYPAKGFSITVPISDRGCVR